MIRVGIASLVVLMLSSVYNMVIVAWILFYLISSFTTVLPWKHCGNYWNTDRNHVLGMTSGLHEIGNMRLEIALYLFIAWATVYLVIWRGLSQSGKIVWVSALFPYVCLLVLLVRGVTLSGATDGLMFYIKPDWSKLLIPRVWIAAGTQVFYSYGVGFGSLMTLGSYNSFHQNFFRDSAIVCIVNPMTSLLSGTVIFSVLGHMAFLAGKTVGDVAKSGPGLAFLVYPEVVARMPASTIWSILFFVMLLFLGINSQFCPLEAIAAGLIDQWPRLVTKRRVINFCLVLVHFLLGLPMTTEAIFLSSVIRYQPLVYAKTYAYPWWAEMLGWFTSLSSIIMIPTYMVYFLVRTPGSLRQRIRAGLSPQLLEVYHS
ncbi:hypothetical protein HPB51_025081 [Rhipicephalus microplus]|uniref:Sodium-neurotransmitter symporter n=1 Tax=Rhipicephalus microplus TaxID=6941 RepID=A0A9J6DKP9_RHIMP|nr:hypothetical protein HPB51_025081 [Rhipicephalus microplus]